DPHVVGDRSRRRRRQADEQQGRISFEPPTNRATARQAAQVLGRRLSRGWSAGEAPAASKLPLRPPTVNRAGSPAVAGPTQQAHSIPPVSEAFFVREGDRYVRTPHTRGPAAPELHDPGPPAGVR